MFIEDTLIADREAAECSDSDFDGALHVRHMQMTNNKGLAKSQQNYAAEISVPESVLLELWRWIRNHKH